MRIVAPIIAVAAVVAAALVGALGAAGDSAIYAALERPAWAPPSWVFGPAWSLLYVLLAIAGALIGRRWGERGAATALGLFIAQLVAQAAWTPLFFGGRFFWLAFADIVLLLVLAAATTALFARISVTASVLMVPYLAWITYAAALNGWIAAVNG
jgi:translocator protein